MNMTRISTIKDHPVGCKELNINRGAKKQPLKILFSVLFLSNSYFLPVENIVCGGFSFQQFSLHANYM